MFNAIRIGFINWYCSRHWLGNVIRNLLFPVWLDWEERYLDFNLIPIIILIILFNIL